MLKIESLDVQAGAYTFKEISLSVGKGQCHVIVGPTGAGKTLLLETVVGFVKPHRGRVLLDEKEISNEPVERRGIGYVPQDLAIFPHLTVEQNIFFGLNVKKERAEDLQKHVWELVEVVGITKLLPRQVGNLSGGELQRVALVRALGAGNKTILLDEPLSSLHESLKRELWFLLKKLQRKFNLSILMVTHDLEEAYFLGDQISILLNGRIEQTGTKGEIYYFPKTRKAAEFVGIRNFFNASVLAAAQGGHILRCDGLETSLTAKGNNPEKNTGRMVGSPVTACIRSENVMVLREGYVREHQDNILAGKIISLFEKGKSHALIFLPEKSGLTIEIEVPDFAMKKMGLCEGKEAAVSLKSESLFLLDP
ncbi:MAG: ABC transporter ATP-binding protein [Nitrospinota bacterium]